MKKENNDEILWAEPSEANMVWNFCVGLQNAQFWGLNQPGVKSFYGPPAPPQRVKTLALVVVL